jgi:glucose/arabinose dehydrogenase
MISTRWFGGLALAMSLGAVSAKAQTDKGSIPPSSQRMVPALDGKLNVPEGLKVQVFADTVRGARFMALGPDGAVYVSQPRAGATGGRGAGPGGADTPRTYGGRVIRLLDRNNDGVADERETVITDVEGAHGLAFHNGYLYIAGLRGVHRVKLDARGKAAGATEQLNTYPFTRGHSTRTIVFGRDGGMYVSIGSSCNICIEASPELAAVMRYDADGKNGRLYSAGLRNAVGMAVHPTTGEIWVSQHERDNLQPNWQDLPSEEINILQDGGHFGWPYCHDDRVPNPDAVVADSVAAGICVRTIPPALKMQAHSAPLGMTFLNNATNLPAEYRGDALVALHGSWNRNVPVGAVVVRVRTQNGKPVSYEEFITGWQGESEPGQQQPNRWGRPVDILVYKDGSLLISDDGGQPATRNPGAIYRVHR